MPRSRDANNSLVHFHTGDLEELDRDLVEQAKLRLQNGETLQRPLDLFDKAPVRKIEYSKETALVVADCVETNQ